MTDISKLTVGFLLTISLLVGIPLGSLVDDNFDSKLWECPSKDFISDCVNGVKGAQTEDGLYTRCYWMINNSYKYEYCSEGWREKVIENGLENTSIFVKSALVCPEDGPCEILELKNSSLYSRPIDCLKNEQYCSVTIDGLEKEYFLSKNNCENSTKLFCDIQYLTEVR